MQFNTSKTERFILESTMHEAGFTIPRAFHNLYGALVVSAARKTYPGSV